MSHSTIDHYGVSGSSGGLASGVSVDWSRVRSPIINKQRLTGKTFSAVYFDEWCKFSQADYSKWMKNWTRDYRTFTYSYNNKRSKPMDKITKEVLKLDLSDDDQLLQKHGLKDSDNQWTDTAVELLDQLLLEDNKAQLVEKLKAVDAKKDTK